MALYAKRPGWIFLTACVLLLCGCWRRQTSGEITLPPVEVITDGAAAAAGATDEAETIVTGEVPVNSKAAAQNVQQSNHDYDVHLEINPAEQTVTGIEKIKFFNETGSHLTSVYCNVYFNAFSKKTGVFQNEMYFDSVSVNNDDTTYDFTDTVLRVDLPQPLPPEETVEIRLQLRASVYGQGARTGSDGESLWFGNFLPTLAVYDQHGWHTATYSAIGNSYFTNAANYNVNITAPDSFTAVGVGTNASVEQSGKKVTTFTATMARDFAFAISDDYQISEITTSEGVNIQLFALTDSLPDTLLTWAERCLEYYGRRIGNYPYSHLTLVETRGLPEGQAYPQLIFLSADSENNFDAVSRLIGRQWFYGIVGNDDTEEAWLSEGLIAFLQAGISTGIPVGADTLRSEMEQAYKTLQKKLTGMNPNGLDQSIYAFTSQSDYETIHRDRGRQLFYALWLEMGAEVFDALLTEYYRKYSFKIASANDLKEIAEELTGRDLSAFFRSWTVAPNMPAAGVSLPRRFHTSE